MREMLHIMRFSNPPQPCFEPKLERSVDLILLIVTLKEALIRIPRQSHAFLIQEFTLGLVFRIHRWRLADKKANTLFNRLRILDRLLLWLTLLGPIEFTYPFCNSSGIAFSALRKTQVCQ